MQDAKMVSSTKCRNLCGCVVLGKDGMCTFAQLNKECKGSYKCSFKNRKAFSLYNHQISGFKILFLRKLNKNKRYCLDSRYASLHHEIMHGARSFRQ